ncbi:hypothetical protein [Tychonema sp. LEGE 07203]|uniref:hypothetical protein n=1 Tax=Tychonema sp. LEGE 07203 TaxID=1828671 RepID=UPI00188236ED|nr:hypothetical protein [Tychonema sp. LEGE 07203]MBE9096012.1 hypothetical protein [Tychonema sp. LEGE 07203]
MTYAGVARNRVFDKNNSLQPADLVKNPVSSSLCAQYKILLKKQKVKIQVFTF